VDGDKVMSIRRALEAWDAFKRLSCVAMLLFVFALCQQSNAFAQSGATGGVIGKQNKETSGDSVSTPEPRQRTTSEPSPRTNSEQRPRALEAGRITVTSATLGANCGAPQGNVTSQVAGICNGHDVCQLPGARVNNPDPAYGCPKSFAAQWKCGAGGRINSAAVTAIPNETNVLTLKCN
jgi:hypothetical protein